MADTTSSIAGLFMTPELYQQRQDQEALAQASQLAQLTGRQRADLGWITAGQQVSKGLAGALGAQDPMMQRLSQRRAFLNQVDMTDPKSLVSAIQNSTQDPELNAFLLGKYKDLTNIMKEQSIIEKNAKWEKQQADASIKRDLVATVEDKLSRNEEVDPVTLNKAKLAFGEITRPRMLQQPDGSVAILPSPIDASVFPNIGKFIGKTGSPVSTQGGGSASGPVGGGASVANVIETPLSLETKRKQLTGLEEGKAQLTSLLGKIDDTERLIGPMSTGWGQKMLGSMPGTDAMTLSDNTQSIKANLALTKLQDLKNASKTGASGLGTLSDKDMATIKETIASLNPLSANYANDLKTIREFFVRAQKAMDKESEILSAKTQEPNVPKQNGLYGNNPKLQPTEEAWIEKAMAKNRGYSRADVIKEGIKAGKLPAGYQ